MLSSTCCVCTSVERRGLLSVAGSLSWILSSSAFSTTLQTVAPHKTASLARSSWNTWPRWAPSAAADTTVAQLVICAEHRSVIPGDACDRRCSQPPGRPSLPGGLFAQPGSKASGSGSQTTVVCCMIHILQLFRHLHIFIYREKKKMFFFFSCVLVCFGLLQIVGEALLYMLQCSLGQAYTASLRQAWLNMYSVVVAAMSRGWAKNGEDEADWSARRELAGACWRMAWRGLPWNAAHLLCEWVT